MSASSRRLLTVEGTAAGARLDRWLAERIPELSRAKLRALIEADLVRVNGRSRKAAHRVTPGERVEVDVTPPVAQTLEPEPIALTIVHEDEHVLVVDKPAGMVVHPGAGHALGTLAAAVLAHAPGTATVGGPRRPGVVHRLDKDTSGLLVFAKTSAAYDSLTEQLAARTVTRQYVAIVHGTVKASGVVDAPIIRHPRDRTRMTVAPRGKGRRAVTRYRVVERLPGFTRLELTLETGRTHQIRVHMASIGHPVAGDRIYGGRSAHPVPVPLDGYALHACRLAFVHPATRSRQEFVSPLPARMERLLSHLRDTG